MKGTRANPSFEKWHSPQCSWYKSAEGCKLGDKCSFEHRCCEEQPRKRSKRSGVRSAVALLKEPKNLGCVFQDVEPPRSSSILRKSSTTTKPIRFVRFTTAVLHNAKLRDQNQSLNKICHGDSHQRGPNAPKFEDRSQEETEWQEHWAREAAWKLAKKILKLKEKHKATFFSPSKKWCLPSPSKIKPEEREFVADSSASMHVIIRKVLNSVELETVTTSRCPTAVITANGDVQTHEEAIVYVRELDIFLTVKILEDTPAVWSLGKLCEDHRYSYEWANGQKPRLIKNGFRIDCNTENYVPIVVAGLSTASSSSSSSATPTSLPQDSTGSIHIPASVEWESRCARRRKPSSRRNQKFKTQYKWGSRARTEWPVLFPSSSDVPEWLREFSENLVDGSVPEHSDSQASSSHEHSLEPLRRGLSSSSSGSSSTSKTPSRQESHSSSSSSTSSSSPTVSEIQIREQEDGINNDTSPVQVSASVDDRSGNLMKPRSNGATR